MDICFFKANRRVTAVFSSFRTLIWLGRAHTGSISYSLNQSPQNPLLLKPQNPFIFVILNGYNKTIGTVSAQGKGVIQGVIQRVRGHGGHLGILLLYLGIPSDFSALWGLGPCYFLCYLSQVCLHEQVMVWGLSALKRGWLRMTSFYFTSPWAWYKAISSHSLHRVPVLWSQSLMPQFYYLNILNFKNKGNIVLHFQLKGERNHKVAQADRRTYWCYIIQACSGFRHA